MYGPGIDPKKLVESLAEESRKTLVQHAVSYPFNHWGPQQGTGVELDGVLLVDAGKLRIFAFQDDRVTVTVIEVRYDEHERNNSPGYDLISSSFKLKSGR